MKKALSLMLALFLGVSCFACTSTPPTTPTESYGDLSSAVLWGAPATEKVLQDVHGIYDEIKTDASVNLTVAKNEKEGHQIIITAGDKKLRYTVTLSDLTASDGTVFDKENVKLFHEKYIAVSEDFAGTGVPLGMYADAIVPYENIVEVGENVIEPHCNQGLYFRFDIPSTQKAGVYMGSAKLTIGGKSQDIPISLNVLDITVSEVNHAKSIFNNHGQLVKGEIDTTQRMMDLYNEALIEYRLCPTHILNQNGHTDEDIITWVDMAYEYMQNPLCSTVCVPYKDKSVSGQSSIDGEVLKKYLFAIANKCFETGYNMFDKLACYMSVIDEPGFQGTWARVEVTIPIYRDALKTVSEKIASDASITSPIKAQVAEGIKNLPNVVTNEYDEKYAHLIDTWCPKFNYYDSEYDRANYDEQVLKWWYGCTGPKNPHPAYMIDSTFYGMRVESWMKAEYNVTGNLYWSTCVSAKYDGYNKVYSDIEDYYATADRYPYSYGDGFLWYPGKMYGVDGPVATLRLEAIRDGLEEYELFYELKNNYADVSESVSAISPDSAFTFDKMMRAIATQVYLGTKVTATNQSFATARNALFSLYSMNKGADLCLTDFVDDGYGKNTYTFVASADAVVKQDGAALTPTQTIGAYKQYVASVVSDKEENSLSLTVQKGDKEYSLTQFIGGKVTLTDAESIGANSFSKEGVSVSASVVDEAFGKAVKVDASEAGANTSQSFRLSGSFVSAFAQDVKKVLIHVYYDGEDEVPFVVAAKHKKSMLYMDLVSTKLVKGMNVVEVELTSKNWEKLGAIDYVIFYLGGKKGEPSRTVYLVDTVAYAK